LLVIFEIGSEQSSSIAIACAHHNRKVERGFTAGAGWLLVAGWLGGWVAGRLGGCDTEAWTAGGGEAEKSGFEEMANEFFPS
jgi:hypothetical protein